MKSLSGSVLEVFRAESALIERDPVIVAVIWTAGLSITGLRREDAGQAAADIDDVGDGRIRWVAALDETVPEPTGNWAMNGVIAVRPVIDATVQSERNG